MNTETKAIKLAHKLVDQFFSFQISEDLYAGENWEIAQRCALECVKQMKAQFKIGFNVPGPDHSHKDSHEWEVLAALPKFIRKYQMD